MNPAEPNHTMRAVVLHRHGGPEVLTLAAMPLPRLKHGQVLVRVRASCVNPRDWLLREGRYVFRFILGEFPIIPGSDIAGEVVAIGPGVSQWQIGQRVFGMQPIDGRMGAYAQYVAIKADALALIPASISFEDAAAVPCAGLTAWGVMVIGLVDNLLRPLLVGKDTRMPDYVVMTTTLGGMAVLGINGFVVGPLIAAMFMALWHIHGTTLRSVRERTDGEGGSA